MRAAIQFIRQSWMRRPPAESAARSGRKGLRDIVDPEGSRLLPAGKCPVVQKWHGEKETASGKFGSRQVVNRGRNWPSHAEMMHRAKLARRRGHDRKRYDQDNVAPRTQKGWLPRMRRWKGPE
jgi:hypothetical protein